MANTFPGQITADGTETAIPITADNQTLSFAGTFNSASIALQVSVNGTFYPLLDSGNSDAPIVVTAAKTLSMLLNPGDSLQFVTTGSSNPVIDYQLTQG